MEVLYLGWVGHNNIGDDLMFENFKSLLTSSTGKVHNIHALLPHDNFNDIDKFDLICLGGSSIIIESCIDILYNAALKNKKTIVWGPGYDSIIKREYLERIETSYSPAYIFNDNMEYKINEIAENSNFFGVRGPLTYDILKKSHTNMNKVTLCGDPGLLTEGLTSTENLDPKYKFTLEDNVAGINFGTSFNKVYGQNEDYILDNMVKTCKKLLMNGYKLYLYSVWDKDEDSLKELYRRLPQSENIILDLRLHNASELISILSNCSFTINFKLHANVLSACSNTPFISLGYRVKCYDFAKSLDMEYLNIFTDEENLEEEIMKRIDFIYKNKSYIKNIFRRKINSYKNILKRTFNFL